MENDESCAGASQLLYKGMNMTTTKVDLDRRGETILIRVSAAEKSDYIRAARSESLKVSTWLRQVGNKRARELLAGAKEG